tara:strand:+ start:2598 stop:3098 length:501 start_codon:yes stop_codon:yes gene_type:complete
MKNTTWKQIEPGQIIRFMYKGVQDNRAVQRVVLVIDPLYRYRKKSTGRVVQFLVGIQLDTLISQPINKQKFSKLIRQFGGLEEEDGAVEVGDLPDKPTRQVTRQTYKTLDRFLQRNDVFRTFFLRECRKKRVFLLDSYKRFPKKDMDKLIIERKISNTIKKFEEML